MGVQLEEKIVMELEKFLLKTSAVRSAFICRKVVQGFEEYLADVGIADFSGYMSNEGIFGNDVLSAHNLQDGPIPKSGRPIPKIGRLGERSIKLGKNLMESALTEYFGVNPTEIPKDKLRDYLAESYTVYKRLSRCMLGIAKKKYEEALGFAGVLHSLPESDFLFLSGPISSHSLPYDGNPALHFSKN